MLEAVLDPEAVAQRGGDQPGPGGRPDQRERRERERHRSGAGALPDRDRQAAVLHHRIEGLLERPREPVDLIDEEDRPRLERGQECGDVALALERGAGGLHERHAELGGEDLRQRGLAKAGWPREQYVVERLVAADRRRDRDSQLVFQCLLADEVLEPPGDAASGQSSSSASASGAWIRGVGVSLTGIIGVLF